MASSFVDSDIDIGVMTGPRVTPLATCTEHEPLLRIPKSIVITWYALKGQAASQKTACAGPSSDHNLVQATLRVLEGTGP